MPKRGATCDSPSGESPAKAKKPNNQGKSELCQLAERFQQQFCQASEVGKDVNLNDVAEVLQVSRRRLYDIVNVLESLRLVSRGGKLTYRWEGTVSLPRLLDTLYAAAASGHNNAAILEGHLPGSCWALTRRMIQQLLLDPGMVPLSVLVQRLEATLGTAATSGASLAGAAAANVAGAAGTAAAAAGSGSANASNSGSAAAGSSSTATVGRRIYDIGSVLSTFGLVQKTLQGGSGPRYRQPVYQWAFEWQSSLTADTNMPQAAQAAAATAAAAATEKVAQLAVHAGHTQLWQGQQQAGQGPAATAVASPAHADPSRMALQAAQQQQQQQGIHRLVGGSEGLRAAADVAAYRVSAATIAAAAPPPPTAAAAAGPALQQRLHQLDTLVASIMSQNGPKTCVTLGQLRSLLQHLKQPEEQQDEQQQQHTPQGAHTTAQQQQQQQQISLDEDQAELDAAESLQQLREGFDCCVGQPQCCSEKQQQQQACCAVVPGSSDCSPSAPICCQHECCRPATDSDSIIGMQLQQACCTPVAAAANPAASKPCCPGSPPSPLQQQQQQQVCCPPGYNYEDCCPGMTCVDLLSQLKSCKPPAAAAPPTAAAAGTVAAAPAATQADTASQQQQRPDRDGPPAAATMLLPVALPAPAAAAAAKSCRCIGLGMQAGYLQGLAQLRAQFDKQYEDQDGQESKEQQQVELGVMGDNHQQQQQQRRQQQCCGDAGAVPAAAAVNADAGAAAAHVVGTFDDHHITGGSDAPDTQPHDYAAFAAEEGDMDGKPPDLRVGSNQLNNSSNHLNDAPQDEALLNFSAATVGANVQQQQPGGAVGAAAAAAAAAAVGAKCCGAAASDQAAAALVRASEPGRLPQQQQQQQPQLHQQQQQELSVLEPWFSTAAKALAGSAGGSSTNTLMDMHGLQGFAAAAAVGLGPDQQHLQQQQHAMATGMPELQPLQHAEMVAAGLAQLRSKQHLAAAAVWAADVAGSQNRSGSEDVMSLQVLHAASAAAAGGDAAGGGGIQAAAAAGGGIPAPAAAGSSLLSPAASELLAVMLKLLKKSTQHQQQQHVLGHLQQQQQQLSALPRGQQALQQLLLTLLSSTTKPADGINSLQQPQQWQQRQQPPPPLHLLRAQQQQQQQEGLPVDIMHRLHWLQQHQQQQQQQHGLQQMPGIAVHGTAAGIDTSLADALARNSQQKQLAVMDVDRYNDHSMQAPVGLDVRLGCGVFGPAAAAAKAGPHKQPGATSIPHSGNCSDIAQWLDTQPAPPPPAAAANVLTPVAKPGSSAAAGCAGAGLLGQPPMDVLLQLLSAQRH